jgi:hypothetical protein
MGLLRPSDGNAMGRYLERYVYDAVGNFLSMQHRGSDPVHPGWTRTYDYNETSQLEPGKRSNRLTITTIGATTETYSTGGDGYDAHGNMLRMPHLQVMQWDFKEQLQMTQRQAVSPSDAEGVQHQGERTWYVYDSIGQRVRKVTELPNNGGLKDERIYLGGFEIYRKNGANPLVRETLHIIDDKQRIALVETPYSGQRTGRAAAAHPLSVRESPRIVQPQSWMIKLRSFPTRNTHLMAVRHTKRCASQTETPKRYRYTCMERDAENGLDYHSAQITCRGWPVDRL